MIVIQKKINEEQVHLQRLNLKGRQVHDLELLLLGGFAPLMGFMGEEEYHSVVETMRLKDGTVFPIPIVLDVPVKSSYKVGDAILLCDSFGNPLAIMDFTSRFTPDKKREAERVYGTCDMKH